MIYDHVKYYEIHVYGISNIYAYNFILFSRHTEKLFKNMKVPTHKNFENSHLHTVGTRRQGGVIFSNKPSNKNVRKFSDSH